MSQLPRHLAPSFVVTVQRWAVFPHAVQGTITGSGYVARPINTDGTPVDSYNYSGVRPVDSRTYVRQVVADKVADKLNSGQ